VRRATRSNVPAAALKWSVERAAPEFGLTHNTLRKLLNKNSVQADAEGLYSTKQITDAVFGGLADEKLATQMQLTRKYQLENSIVVGTKKSNRLILQADSALNMARMFQAQFAPATLLAADQDSLTACRPPCVAKGRATRSLQLGLVPKIASNSFSSGLSLVPHFQYTSARV